MNNVVIALLRLGFHGFAVVMLYLGYRLLRTVVAERASPASESTAEIRGLQLRLKEVRIFCFISLIFFVLGVASELLRQFQVRSQENEMTMQVQPEIADMLGKELIPILLEGREMRTVSMGDNTSAFIVNVKHRQLYYLKLHPLAREVDRLRKLLANQRSKEQEENAEGGLDDG